MSNSSQQQGPWAPHTPRSIPSITLPAVRASVPPQTPPPSIPQPAGGPRYTSPSALRAQLPPSPALSTASSVSVYSLPPPIDAPLPSSSLQDSQSYSVSFRQPARLCFPKQSSLTPSAVSLPSVPGASLKFKGSNPPASRSLNDLPNPMPHRAPSPSRAHTRTAARTRRDADCRLHNTEEGLPDDLPPRPRSSRGRGPSPSHVASSPNPNAAYGSQPCARPRPPADVIAALNTVRSPPNLPRRVVASPPSATDRLDSVSGPSVFTFRRHQATDSMGQLRPAQSQRTPRSPTDSDISAYSTPPIPSYQFAVEAAQTQRQDHRSSISSIGLSEAFTPSINASDSCGCLQCTCDSDSEATGISSVQSTPLQGPIGYAYPRSSSRCGHGAGQPRHTSPYPDNSESEQEDVSFTPQPPQNLHFRRTSAPDLQLLAASATAHPRAGNLSASSTVSSNLSSVGFSRSNSNFMMVPAAPMGTTFVQGLIPLPGAGLDVISEGSFHCSDDNRSSAASSSPRASSVVRRISPPGGLAAPSGPAVMGPGMSPVCEAQSPSAPSMSDEDWRLLTQLYRAKRPW